MIHSHRFTEATFAGRCHAGAPDCGCDWPVMEATLWMAYAQRDPTGMAMKLNAAAIAELGAILLGIWKVFTADDVRGMVADGRMEVWLRTIEESTKVHN